MLSDCMTIVFIPYKEKIPPALIEATVGRSEY